MPRLFIDVDDTLILYPESDDNVNPLGLERGLNFKLNDRLVDAIQEWLKKNHSGIVVVWSGGGEAYARSVAERFLPGVGIWFFTKGGRNLGLPNSDDVLVDDSPEDLGLDQVDAVKLLPEEFIESMRT